MPNHRPTARTTKAAAGRQCGGTGDDSERVIEDDAFDFNLYAQENRKSYEEGDKAALLRVIEQCALFRRALPEWASHSFDSIYRAALAGKIESWDDVFGRPYQQEKGRAQQRSVRTQSQKWQVWTLVRELHEGEGKPPIDNALFERVGRKLGIGGKSMIADLYGQVERAARRVRSRKR
jgi:hypothetical protein